MTLFAQQAEYPEVYKAIDSGEYAQANELIEELLDNPATPAEDKIDLQFQQARMKRIRLDFTRSLDEILEYVRKYYPDVNDEMIAAWENSKALEYKYIDGGKKYFARAAPNLFRIDPEAKARKKEVDGDTKDGLTLFIEKNVPEVVADYKANGERLGEPVRMKLTYSVAVDADAVPDGETVRCWLPYPREGNPRQAGIELLSVSEDEYIIADNDNLQRSLYMEKTAEKGKPVEFGFELEMTTRPDFAGLDFDGTYTIDEDSEAYRKYTAEEPPHIVFTDEIKAFNEEIVGDETEPLKIAQKLFSHISENFPWASAREYSTIPNIPMYCLTQGRGDCGQVTLLFITLCRLNGIPAKWESGWMLHPGQINLHDWSEIYFDQTGWVPVDQSFGLVDADDEAVKYFYLGGIDAYRLIVNDAYSTPFFPLKIFPRSETVDFQRGEVEWRGGNLYFNQWDYHMDVEYLDE